MKPPLSFGAALLGCCATALAEPPARSLDQALTETLSLGNAFGCGPAFGLPDFSTDPNPQLATDTFIRNLRDSHQIGKELAAICGSSAVSSSSALGGSLGSVQTTKTVSQFRLARSRADSRLNARGKRAGLDTPILLAQLGDRPPVTGSPADDGDLGAGVFVQLGAERRDRKTTPLEAGWRADVGDAIVGVDYATRDLWLVGGWVGWRRADAHYRNPLLLVTGSNDDFGPSLTPEVQADICNLRPAGGFDDEGARLGGFVAKRFGNAFADVALQYSRRDYRYRRNVCALETSGALTPDPDNPGGYLGGGVPVDDIYAGTITGKPHLTEWGVSARAGFDVAAGERWQWGPRLSLTYLRTTLGAYTESGRTSVTNTVRSNTDDPANPGEKLVTVVRSAGDPTGLELAFDRQRRTSLQSELQFVAAYRIDTQAGAVVPRAAASWLHEFRGERQLVQVHMAQDRRADPVRFGFTTDRVDRNKGSLAVGASWAHPSGLVADIELSRLVGDDRFDATRLSLQAHWRF